MDQLVCYPVSVDMGTVDQSYAFCMDAGLGLDGIVHPRVRQCPLCSCFRGPLARDDTSGYAGSLMPVVLTCARTYGRNTRDLSSHALKPASNLAVTATRAWSCPRVQPNGEPLFHRWQPSSASKAEFHLNVLFLCDGKDKHMEVG